DGPWWKLYALDETRPDQPERARCWCPVASTVRQLGGVAGWFRHVPPNVDLVGPGKDGSVHSLRFEVDDEVFELVSCRAAMTEGGYLAATQANGAVVAVSHTRVDWLSHGSGRLSPCQNVPISLPSAIACFPSPVTQEVLVVCSDGFIARLSAPSRQEP